MEAETALSSILSITTSINNINTEVTGTFIIAQLVCDIGMAENVFQPTILSVRMTVGNLRLVTSSKIGNC